MLKKVLFYSLIVMVMVLSAASLVVMYRDDGRRTFKFSPDDISGLPVDLSDAWVVSREIVVQEVNLERKYVRPALKL